MLKALSESEMKKYKAANWAKPRLRKHVVLRHTCDSFSEDEIKKQSLRIYLRDGQPHAMLRNIGTFGSVCAGAITFCPYCCIEIEKDERS